MQMNPKLSRFLLPALLMIALYAGLLLLFRAIGIDRIHTHLQHMGMWAPIVFLLLCMTGIIIAPLSATTIYVTSGVLFEPSIAFVLSFVGTVFGCIVNFWISRKLGRGMVAHLIGKGNLDALDQFTHRLKGHHRIAFMILIMPISQDVLSYAIGLTKVKFLHFFIAVVVTSLATTGIAVFLGSRLFKTLI
jgi:uncharacterized membrane protein YdjX (TVP38/TMEM64 family)